MQAYKPPTAGTWRQEKLKLADVFRMWGITEWDANANVPDVLANRNYEGYESDVTVTFIKDGKPVTLTMDRYSYPPQNLKVLTLCIDDMRMIERRGISDTMQSAYMQLAAPVAERDPYEVLGLRPGASVDEIEAMFRVKAKVAHPDVTHDDGAAMKVLNAARDRLLAVVKVSA